MTYPISDHSDGQRFHCPAGFDALAPLPAISGAPTSVLRWMMGHRPRWPHLQTPRRLTTPAEVPDPGPGEMSVTFINHASFLLRFGRLKRPPLTIVTDPIFSLRCAPFRHFGPARVRAPGITLAALPRVDIALVSHCHYDHLDLPTLRYLARRDNPLCIAPLGNARHLRHAGLTRIVELDWWESYAQDDVTLTATPARHGSARTPFDAGKALWSGFHIRHTGPDGAGEDSPTVYFAGDTAHGPHWRMIAERLGAPDLALLPIGAYEPRGIMHSVHTTPEEALAGFSALGARAAIGMHFGTFQLTDEGVFEPPARLRLATRRAGLPDEAFVVLDHGESRRLRARDLAVPPKTGTTTQPDAG